MNYIKSLAKQPGPKGIRVNGVAPGPVWTPLQVSGEHRKESRKKIRQPNFLLSPGSASRTRLDLRSIGGGRR
jgi:NAD(P)-dependent dehydrogenase (short-subunit alcohol dehydrogenase family)